MNYREFFSTTEARSWADKHYSSLLHGADCSYLREILFHYTGTLNKLINAELRRFSSGGSFCIEAVPFEDPDLKEKACLIQNALLSYALSEDIVVYRYTRRKAVKANCGGHVQNRAVISDPGFQSTSLVRSCMKSFAREHEMDCLLKIYLPKGFPGAYISEYREEDRLDENEYLLPAGTKLKIIKRRLFTWPMVFECIPLAIQIQTKKIV
ncbi:MAG: hypothetical protein IJL47_06080 [Lachnospiraceae bacterium]|nr:hypothetical protein [Lachnospiraceae bacterium]